jgi:hypothetical protein
MNQSLKNFIGGQNVLDKPNPLSRIEGSVIESAGGEILCSEDDDETFESEDIDYIEDEL